jgi:hypothetical protein
MKTASSSSGVAILYKIGSFCRNAFVAIAIACLGILFAAGPVRVMGFIARCSETLQHWKLDR